MRCASALRPQARAVRQGGFSFYRCRRPCRHCFHPSLNLNPNPNPNPNPNRWIQNRNSQSPNSRSRSCQNRNFPSPRIPSRFCLCPCLTSPTNSIPCPMNPSPSPSRWRHRGRRRQRLHAQLFGLRGQLGHGIGAQAIEMQAALKKRRFLPQQIVRGSGSMVVQVVAEVKSFFINASSGNKGLRVQAHPTLIVDVDHPQG